MGFVERRRRGRNSNFGYQGWAEAGTRFLGDQLTEQTPGPRVLREAGVQGSSRAGGPQPAPLALTPQAGFPVGPPPGAAAERDPTRGPENCAEAGNAGAETRREPGASSPRLPRARRPQAGAVTPRPWRELLRGEKALRCKRKPKAWGFRLSPPVGQPGSLALTYPSWPSGWCPTAPTFSPAAASGRSAGRTALPGRWAARRSRGAPRAPVAPCRPLLQD